MRQRADKNTNFFPPIKANKMWSVAPVDKSRKSLRRNCCAANERRDAFGRLTAHGSSLHGNITEITKTRLGARRRAATAAPWTTTKTI